MAARMSTKITIQLTRSRTSRRLLINGLRMLLNSRTGVATVLMPASDGRRSTMSTTARWGGDAGSRRRDVAREGAAVGGAEGGAGVLAVDYAAHPELEDRVFREVLWNHLHGEVSFADWVSRVTGLRDRRCCGECMNWRSLENWFARTGAI